jgi:methyl-accepting chemotaxis protein
MKLGGKLLVAPLVAIAFLVALAGAGYYAMTLQQSAADNFYTGVFTRYRTAVEAEAAVGRVHAGIYRLLSISEAFGADHITKEQANFKRQLTAAQDSLKRLTTEGDAERKQVSAAVQKLSEYMKAADLAIELGSVDANTGAAAMQTADQAFIEMSRNLASVVEAERKVAEQIFEDTRASARRTLLGMLLLALAAIVIALLTAALQARNIVRRLTRATTAAEALARGDLTARASADSGDEVGQMLGALGNSSTQLAQLVGSVRHTTDAVSAASSEIARGNQNLSERTEQQASSLEETAATLEQLTATVRQNAESAHQASQLATVASGAAGKGGQVVEQVVETMDGITGASKKISEITSVIDGIAFQTNLLALNAAVEAARAGDQGRGFAVVASEVRNLAQRSAAAAKEIKALIDDSVRRVESGSKLVGQTGAAMGEIVSAVKSVTEIIDRIRIASQEQSGGIDQVNQAMSAIDGVTQQNAALVEEAAAAAASLQEQAQNLVAAVVAFKLEEDSAHAVAVETVSVDAAPPGRQLARARSIARVR